MITLLTDFGLRDGYVGTMKGVIASIAPATRVVDICHDVAPQDLQHAGVAWGAALPYFPRGCVHVAVVDPGVGTRRRLLLFRARGSVFLVPDNGLIGYVLSRREIRDVIHIKNRRYFLPEVSATFHGRDIFAPVAARLAAGLEPSSLGPSITVYRRNTLPRPRRRQVQKRPRVVEERGEVLYVDGFGNVVINIRPQSTARFRRLNGPGFEARRLRRTYGDVPPGELVVFVGSMGWLEIACHGGNAAEVLGWSRGERISVRWG